MRPGGSSSAMTCTDTLGEKKVKFANVTGTNHMLPPLNMENLNQFRVFLGSYERLLYGLDVECGDEEYIWKLTTAYAPHIGPIQSITSSSKYLATGSSDEIIKLRSST